MNPLQYYFVPEWVGILFLIAIPLPFILISHLVWKTFKGQGNPIPFAIVVLFFSAYLIYIGVASRMGWFNQVFFPPKVLLLSTFPYALLLFMLLPRMNWFKIGFDSVSVDQLVGLHIFRLLGSFFLLLAFFDALPKTFAIIAGTGDVIAAISSPWVAKQLRQKAKHSKRLGLAWNVFGTIDILFTAIGANVLTKLSIDHGSMGVDTLAFFPFCIIPAFAPPTILFLHWLIFKKLQNYQA